MHRFFKLLFLAFVVGICILSKVSGAEEKGRLSLPQALKAADRGNSSLRAGQLAEEVAAQERARVDGEFGPRLKARLGVGPITAARGNAVFSEQDRDEFGAAVVGSLEFTWPLWTWGRKESFLRAAHEGVQFKKAETTELRQQTRYEVKEAYYGVLLALSLKNFVSSNRGKVEGVLEDLKKRGAKRTERYRIEILLAQIDGKEAEIEAAYATARAGLAVRTGTPGAIPADEWLEVRKRPLPSLKSLHALLASHPQKKKLRVGLAAKAALREAARKGRYPVLAFLAKYDYSDASVRDDQQSAFAYDPFNTSQAVIGVGLNWDFPFGRYGAKISKLESERAQLLAQQQWAEQGLAALVTKAHSELVRSEKQLDAAKRAHKLAKKWLNKDLLAWGSGLADAKRMIDSFGARAVTGKEYFEAIFRYELAWAELARVVGQEVDPQLSDAI